MLVSYFTHTGKVSKNNEDAILINNILISQKDLNDYELIELALNSNQSMIFAVADGMGGHSKGEVASFLVLDYLRKNFQKIEHKKSLIDILQGAKNTLNQYVKENPTAYGMGTVIAGMMISSGNFIIFNVGDARIYHHKNHFTKRISKDHSVVEELKDRGFITEEEVRTHHQKHIITSSISGDREEIIPMIFIKEFDEEFFQDSKVLICSDGLWEMLTEQEIHLCLEQSDLKVNSRCLKNKAFLNGAFDNISFILIQF